MYKKALCLSGLLGLAISLSSTAHAVPTGLEIGAGYAGYENPDDIDDSKGSRVHLGYRFNNPWAIELSHSFIEAAVEHNGDDHFQHTTFNTLYHFGEGAFQSYLLLGAGGYMGNGAVNTAFGLKMKMGRLEVRPEIGVVKALSESNESHNINTPDGIDTVDVNASLTFSILLGSNSKKVTTVAPKAVLTPTDTDGDGLVDTADSCTETPLGAPIDEAGCALDLDSDSIIDLFDKCPDTAADLKVDEQGCPQKLEEDVSISLNVNFDSGSSVVNTRYYEEIAKVAKFLQEYENTSVVIEGHTDTRGPATANKSLSQNRADAVAQVLTTVFGIPLDRVSSKGYGEERPIAVESTKEDFLKNRRVVATVKTKIERFEKK